jgi:DNA-binding CsgD family transcriptional regulator
MTTRRSRKSRDASTGVAPPEVPPPRGLTAKRMTLLGDEHIVLSFPLDAPKVPASLTKAEQAVALLVLEGRTDAEIAAARGVSKRTVANQIAAVFRKLEVSSRVELAARLRAED